MKIGHPSLSYYLKLIGTTTEAGVFIRIGRIMSKARRYLTSQQSIMFFFKKMSLDH